MQTKDYRTIIRCLIAALALVAMTACSEDLTWEERWQRDIIGGWNIREVYQVNIETLYRTDDTYPAGHEYWGFPYIDITLAEDKQAVFDGEEGTWYLYMPKRKLTLGSRSYEVTHIDSDTLKFYHELGYLDSTYNCTHIYVRRR